MDLRGFLGGHPFAVFVLLAILSVLTGIVLSVFGITPANFFQTLDDLARRIYDMGFACIESEDEPYLQSIPYMQFPVSMGGRIFTGERGFVPG